MKYTVTYRTHAMSNGNLQIDAYIYETGATQYEVVISHNISPPTWIERRLRITLENKIDDAKNILEKSITKYIKNKSDKKILEKAVNEFLNGGNIEGAVIDKDYNPRRTPIGFNTTPLIRDRPAIKPPQ